MLDVPIRHVPDVYRRTVALHGDRPAFGTRKGEGREIVAWREVLERATALATALIDFGLEAREHVAILSDHRVEWVVADLAILTAGAADVPRGSDIVAQELEYILDHAQVRVAFVETSRVLEMVLAARSRLPRLSAVVLMDPAVAAPEGVLRMEALVERGRALVAGGDRRSEDRLASIRPDDLFTLIYTSGTTGVPKGVQLTHANMLSQVRNIPVAVRADDRMLSILPVWHSYERVFLMVAVAAGACTHFTTARTLADDLIAVRPTLMASAPRLWESLHDRIQSAAERQPALRRALFRAAVLCAVRTMRARHFLSGRALDTEGRAPTRSAARAAGSLLVLAVLGLPALLLDALALRKIRGRLGGAFRGTLSGGGALPLHIDEFFNAVGVPVLEGYGMTETSPVVAVRLFENLVVGTVGPLYPETEVRIVDLDSGAVLYPDPAHPSGGRGRVGEIRVRGPQVMKGYYRNAEATERVLRDGWMSTGDLGMMTFNDCLRIVGRSKDTVVLSIGENVEPVPIESRLCESPLIAQCMVVGQDRKNLGALVVPSLDGLRAAGIQIESLSAAGESEAARRAIAAEIKRLVCAEAGFKPFELIAGWRALPKPFEVGDELTSTYKLRRHVVAKKYEESIESIYART